MPSNGVRQPSPSSPRVLPHWVVGAPAHRLIANSFKHCVTILTIAPIDVAGGGDKVTTSFSFASPSKQLRTRKRSAIRCQGDDGDDTLGRDLEVEVVDGA